MTQRIRRTTMMDGFDPKAQGNGLAQVVPKFNNDSKKEWYTIIVDGPSKLMDRYQLIQKIRSAIGIPIQAFCYTRTQKVVNFYVQGLELAKSIEACPISESTIRLTFLACFSRHPPPSPDCQLTSEFSELLRDELRARLSPSTGHLDLSNFALTNRMIPTLDFYLPFKNIEVQRAINDVGMEMEQEWIDQVNSVDLSFNELQSFADLEFITMRGRNITCLNVSNNDFRVISVLESLSRLPLVELVLENNPFGERYEKRGLLRGAFISECRHYCPKLVKLDREPLAAVKRPHLPDRDKGPRPEVKLVKASSLQPSSLSSAASLGTASSFINGQLEGSKFVPQQQQQQQPSPHVHKIEVQETSTANHNNNYYEVPSNNNDRRNGDHEWRLMLESQWNRSNVRVDKLWTTVNELLASQLEMAKVLEQVQNENLNLKLVIDSLRPPQQQQQQQHSRLNGQVRDENMRDMSLQFDRPNRR